MSQGISMPTVRNARQGTFLPRVAHAFAVGEKNHFRVQDIAMTRDVFLRTVVRNAIDPSLEERALPKPGPL